MTQHSNSMDAPTMVLAFAFILAGIVAAMLVLTPAGAAAVGAALLIPWFFGRPAIAVWTLVMAGAGLLYDFLSGIFTHVLNAFWSAYSPALVSGNFLRMMLVWWNFGLEPRVWMVSGPIGLILGAAIVLVREERRQSELYALADGRPPPEPRSAPITVFCRWQAARKSPARADRTVLGTEMRTGALITVSNHDIRHHILSIGASGAGKTNSQNNIIQSFLERGQATTVIDGKGNSQQGHDIILSARALGRNAYFFDGTQTYQDAAVYNPFAYGDYTSCADRIIAIREWSEPFYKTEAQGFAQMMFHVLQELGIQVDLITASDYLNSSRLLGLVRKYRKKVSNAQALADEIMEQSAAEKNIEALRAELCNLARSALRPLFDTAAARAAGRPVIDLHQAREENALTYFSLPALMYPELAATLGKLIVNDCKATAFSARNPWLLCMDEAGVFAGPQLLTLANQGREFFLQLVIATISLSDLARGTSGNGDAFVQQILASVSSFLVHRLNSPVDAESFALVGGTAPGVTYTAQTAASASTGMASARLTREFQVHPDVLKRLKVGEAIWINKNRGEIKKIHTRLCKIGR